MPPAFTTLYTDISPQPHHLPVIAAAGVDFLESYHITELDFQDHGGAFPYRVIFLRYSLILSLNSPAAFPAAAAKSLPLEAYNICRDELIIVLSFLASTPYLTTSKSSPPCAPTPGISSGISGYLSRISFNSSGYVAPTTSPRLPCMFHAFTFSATISKSILGLP